MATKDYSPPARQLLSAIVEDRARHQHARPYARIPRSLNSTEYREVTYAVLARAVDRVAHILITSLGRRGSFEPVIYVGPSDLRYQILALAAPKAGYSVFFTSPTNSVQTQAGLIRSARVTTFAHAADYPTPLVASVKEHNLNQIRIPELDILLDHSHVEPVTSSLTPSTPPATPWVLLQIDHSHTEPSFATITHAFSSSIEAWSALPINDAANRFARRNVFCAIPATDIAGLLQTISIAILNNSTIVLPPSGHLTAEIFTGIHKGNDVSAAVVPSALLEDVGQEEVYLQSLAKVRSITYTGAAPSRPTGEKISAVASLMPSIVSPYFGAVPLLPVSKEKWEYIRFNTGLKGLELRAQHEATSELVLVKTTDDANIFPIFATSQSRHDYPTGLLFSPHPAEPDLWKYAGHTDNTGTETPIDSPFLDSRLSTFIDKKPATAATTASDDASDKLLPMLPANTSFFAKVVKFLDKKNNYAEEPPDGGWLAWLQVFGCFLVFVNNQGMSFAFGVFQAYYQKYAFPHQSASNISWIGTLQASLTLIVGILAGPLFDKGYFFPVLIVGSVGMVFSYMMLSLCTEYWQVMLCQGVLAGICSGLLYIPSISQIPLYFLRKRGTALGLVTAGAPFGGIIYPIIFKELLERQGFPAATRAIGFVCAAFLLTAIIVIKPLTLPNRPKKLRDPTMFKDPYYVSFLLTGFLLFCGLLTPFILCATYYYQVIQPSIDNAFYTVAIINAANFMGRFLPGLAVDRGFGPETFIFTSTIALSILGFAWIPITTRGGYYPFMILWGLFSGAIAALPAAALPYLCPNLDVFATRLGVLYACAGVGVLIGTPIATAADNGRTDFLGSKLWVGLTAALAVVSCAHCSFQLRRKRLAFRAAEVRRREERSAGVQLGAMPGEKA